MASRSSHPILSYADGIATTMSDIILLVARLLLAALFLMTVWGGGPNVAYLKSINYIVPEFMSPLAHAIEWVVIVSLILGLATRYGALLGFVFVVIAFASAHRYWGYPEAAQAVQYTFLTKDIAIAGGLLALFVTGAGRLSIDGKLKG
jgi:putative oxidoreductase